MELKTYFQMEPQERAKLDDAQIEHAIALELMVRGVVVPRPPPQRKRPQDVGLARESAYVVKVGHTDLPIAFRTAEEAAKFLELRPMLVSSDWECGGVKYTQPMDRAQTALELLPDEDAITLRRDELRKASKDRTLIENEAREYSTKLRAVEKVRDEVVNDWREQQDKYSELGNVQMAYNDFVKLAGGNKDMALACLRKAFGDDVVLEAAAWLNLPELSRELPPTAEVPPAPTHMTLGEAERASMGQAPDEDIAF